MAESFCYWRCKVANAGKVALLGLVLGTLGSGGAAANSVDCQQRPTQVDRVVCGSQALLNLDTAYAKAYRAAKESAEDASQFMKLAQSDLRWRAENCSDASCIEEWYRNVTPRYRALASNARAYGNASSLAARPASSSSAARSSSAITPSNVAVAQCNVLRGMMTSVPMWRDNGVAVEQAAMNVAGALSAFAPDAVTNQEWISAVTRVYSSGATSADLSVRYQALCEPYERLTILAPKPR